MATAADITNSEILACPICFEPFNSPRSLPCLHTLCEKCLDSHIKSQVQGGSHFMYPICETATAPPDSKLAVDKWSGAFPLNNIIIHMMESSEENTDELCQPCKTDGDTNIAEFWCTDCQEQLCSSCKRSHKGMKMSRHHRVVPVDEKQQGQQPNLQLNFIQDCTRHRGQRLELFCTDHRELCCLLCSSSSHRRCDNVRSINDVTEEQERISAYANVNKDVIKIETELNKLLTDRSNDRIRKEQEKDQILLGMDAIVDKAIAKLGSLRKNFRDETERLHNDKKLLDLKNDKIVRCLLQNVANSRQILGRIEQITSTGQKFVLCENIRSQVTSHYQQLKYLLRNHNENVHFTMKPNSFLIDLETTQPSLGTIEISTSTSAAVDNKLRKIDDAMKKLNLRTNMNIGAQVEKIDFTASTVTFVKSVTREKLGKDTWFTGGTYLNNGHLMMADYYNSRLVELNYQYDVVREYKIDGQPTDVVAGKNELYIAVNRQYIFKCKLDTNLKVTSRTKAPDGTCGIAVVDCNVIVSTLNSVDVMTEDGITVKSIPIQTGGYYSCIAKAYTERSFYHRDADTVVCRTLEGNEQFKYTHQQLVLPVGMCNDTQNNLYICAVWSKNVHQVSFDGKRSRVLLDKLKTIVKPHSVVFNPESNEFIISSYNEDTVFEIYRLN